MTQEIEIRKVESLKDLKKFIQFRYDLYRDDPYDVPYLYFDEMNTLRRDRNASFEDCDADYFIAYREGKAVGRVAAIINHKANEQWHNKVVRFGWFDFIDDAAVSSQLLSTVEQWGRERGMEQMVGPMGFADTDREGMLIEGFDTLATMYASHNYPYSVVGFEIHHEYQHGDELLAVGGDGVVGIERAFVPLNR